MGSCVSSSPNATNAASPQPLHGDNTGQTIAAAVEHSNDGAPESSGALFPQTNGRAGAIPGSIASASTIALPLPVSIPMTAPRKQIVLPIETDFNVGINGRNGYSVDDIYKNLNEELGKGNFGTVYKAMHRHSSDYDDDSGDRGWHMVAIKKTAPTVLDRRGGVRIWTHDEVESKCQEIKTLMHLRQTNNTDACILYLYEYFWTYDHSTGRGDLVIVTELLGLELEQWRQRQSVFAESSAKQIARVLLGALDYMHYKGVVHRDLKLQNIMFQVDGDFKTLKIVDFGLAKKLDERQKVADFCGSLGYISPEIYRNRPYRFEVDMFAFGVILFRLLSGDRPFSSTNSEKIKRDTINLSYRIEGQVWETVSPDALTLVRKLLIGREQRYSAEEAANADWFKAQDESILRVNHSVVGECLSPSDDDYSRAVALTEAPAIPQAHQNDNCFWLDSSIKKAVGCLIAEQKCIGKLIEEGFDAKAGLLCFQEVVPEDAIVLPIHVRQLDFYTERQCRNICRQVAEIINIAHQNGMAHRNIHLNSFLINRSGSVMIKGLQYAQVVEEKQPLTGHFGYLYSWYAFKAPEIDSELFHRKSVDLWSLGALIYMLLVGVPPFRGDGEELVRNKHRGEIDFELFQPSDQARCLLEGLLKVNPVERPTISEVLECDWMDEADEVLDKYDLTLAQAIMQDWEASPSSS